MADTFALSLAAFAEKAPEKARTVVRRVALDTLSRVVMRTPVGNPATWKSKPPAGYVGGRLRGNWAVSIGVPGASPGAGPDRSPRGRATVARESAQINAADGEQPIYIMNSLPYVRVIEYEGHSGQAPAGMVRVTVTEMQAVVADIVRSVA